MATMIDVYVPINQYDALKGLGNILCHTKRGNTEGESATGISKDIHKRKSTLGRLVYFVVTPGGQYSHYRTSRTRYAMP